MDVRDLNYLLCKTYSSAIVPFHPRVPVVTQLITHSIADGSFETCRAATNMRPGKDRTSS